MSHLGLGVSPFLMPCTLCSFESPINHHPLHKKVSLTRDEEGISKGGTQLSSLTVSESILGFIFLLCLDTDAE